MHDAHRVLDGDELGPAGGGVALGAAEAREDHGGVAALDVGAVELGGHLHGEGAAAEGGVGGVGVGRGGGEVAAHGHEGPHPPVGHGPDGVDGVVAVVAGRLEAELGAERVEERRRRLLVDPHRAVALHVAVAPHRAEPGAGPADVAAAAARS